MITKTELLNKTKEYIKLNHIDEITADNDRFEIMWWIIENHLDEEQQMIIVYKLFFYEDETDSNDTMILFGMTRHKFGGTITRINKQIRQIWEQLSI